MYKIEITFGNGTKRIIHKASREAQLRAMRRLERRVRMKEGIALQNVWTSGGRKGARATHGECIGPSKGDWVMVTCNKCEDCGRSVSYHGQLTLAA